jgi:hypothetical protein
LFEHLVDHEHCYVLAAHDRDRALKLLRILNASGVLGMVAVIDADFGRVNGQIESDENLFFCDGHDLGIMLVRSPAFDRVVSEHCSKEKLEAFLSARQPNRIFAAHLANSCRPLGALLLTSLTRDLGLTFDGLAFAEFMDKTLLECDIRKMVICVMNKSNRHEAQLRDDLIADVLTRLRADPDAWELARGHDCVRLLEFSLQSTVGTRKSRDEDRRSSVATAETLERELRLAFSREDFLATALAESITRWEQASPDYRLLLRA